MHKTYTKTYTTPWGLIIRFRSWFEEDGTGGYVYRLRGKGRPIPVSDEERRRFIGRYVTRVFATYGVMLAAGLIFFTLYLGIGHSSKVPTPSAVFSDPFFYAGFGLIVLPAYALIEWFGQAPVRALKDRASAFPLPTEDETQAITFRNLTYGNLALTAMAGGATYRYIADRHWDPRWILIPVLIVLVAAVQAFRKWRFEHP